MSPNAPQKTDRPGAAALRVAAALAALALVLGCATSPAPTPADGTAAVSTSRCAPGAVLDARHRLCNGASGRWW